MPLTDITPSAVFSVLVFWLIVWYRWSRRPGTPLPSVATPQKDRLENPPVISIIVPARNEARHIETCVRSLLAQDYPQFEVIVVDDCSEDATGSILTRLAESDGRLTVVRGEPVPSGWMGKAHAIYQGYGRAKGDWLLFTDADTTHAPHLLSAVMAQVLQGPAAFATVIGDQQHPTVGAYMANVAVFMYIFLFTDPKNWSNPKSRQSLVNGQYVLFSREAYEAIGTHMVVRHYSSTDVTLGYLAKMDGWVPLLINGHGALDTTMYRDFRDAFQGWSRSLVNGAWTVLGPARGSAVLITVTAGLCLFWIAPWIGFLDSLLHFSATGLAVGSLQILAGVTIIRVARGRWLPAIGHSLVMPFSMVLFVAMAGEGLVRAWTHGGTVWKGRVVRTGQRLPPWRPRARKTLSGTRAGV